MALKNLNQKITGFYDSYKGLLWLSLVVIIALFYLVNPAVLLMESRESALDAAYRSPMMAEKASFRESILPPPTPGEEAGYVAGEEKRIRKSGSLSLDVEKENYDNAKKSIEEIIEQHKGFYVSKNEYKNVYGDVEYRTYATTIKVPVTAFDTVLEQLKKSANVKNVNSDASDVTSQYHDTKMELESQKALRKRIEELLARAEKIEDIIRLEEKLNEYQRRIDDIQRQLINLERQTDYATIYITLEEKHEIKESLYEFTGLQALAKNIILSINNVLVVLSKLVGWAILALIIWGGYRMVKKVK